MANSTGDGIIGGGSYKPFSAPKYENPSKVSSDAPTSSGPNSHGVKVKRVNRNDRELQQVNSIRNSVEEQAGSIKKIEDRVSKLTELIEAEKELSDEKEKQLKAEKELKEEEDKRREAAKKAEDERKEQIRERIELAKKEHEFNKAVIKDKISILDSDKEEYLAIKDGLSSELELLEAREKELEKNKDIKENAEELEEIDKRREKIRSKLAEIDSRVAKNDSLRDNLAKAEEERLKRIEALKDKSEGKNKKLIEAKKKENDLLKQQEEIEKRIEEKYKEKAKLKDRYDSATGKEKEDLDKKIKSIDSTIDEDFGSLGGILKDLKSAKADTEALENGKSTASPAATMINRALGTINNVLGGIAGIAQKLLDKVDGNIVKGVEFSSAGIGKVNTRLQGMESTLGEGYTMFDEYKKSLDVLAISYTVSVPKYMDNLLSVIDAGIASDVENKALLATLSERMVTTFNVLDEHLTKLVRLQQADLSAAQLGAESKLTELLNSMFKNTQYLGSSSGGGLYDTVAGLLVDATANMSGELVTGFEYAVQKWMGALYSVGLSDSAIENIVSGIVNLATGDVNKLSSNDQLTNLLALSASNAGLSYSEMLTNGLNASNINSLLESMVKYLADIYRTTSNQVTKSAWGDIFNLNTSDLRAFSNLTNEDIVSIAQSNIDYTEAILQTNEQLVKAVSADRLGYGGRYDTFFENLLFVSGMNLEQSPDAYQLYYKSKYVYPEIMDAVSGIIDLLPEGTLTSVLENFAGIIDSSIVINSANNLANIIGGTASLAEQQLFMLRNKAVSDDLAKYIGEDEAKKVSESMANYKNSAAEILKGTTTYNKNSEIEYLKGIPIIGPMMFGLIKTGQASRFTEMSFDDKNAADVDDVVLYLSGLSYLEKYNDYLAIKDKRGVLFDSIEPTTYSESGGELSTGGAVTATAADMWGAPSTVAKSVTENATQVKESVDSIISNSERIESQATTVTSTQSTNVYDISSVYDALFVNQMAVKVKLADYDEAALNKLASVINSELLAEALDKINNRSLDVDLVEDDSESIIDTIMKVRGF